MLDPETERQALMDFGSFYQFRAGRLEPVAENAEVALAVADSWLFDGGRVRSLQAHYERFVDGVARLDYQQNPSNVRHGEIAHFFEAVIALIPEEGRWFPRVEFHGGQAQPLFVKLREAPAQLGEARLWSLDQADPRDLPTVKGPDLSLCMQLRRKAQVHGADEAVLLDDTGRIIEGALSSLVWWRDGALEAPDLHTTWLDSITRHEVFAIAAQLGLETREVAATEDQLEGCEVWILSSLQGVRQASSWLGSKGTEIAIAPVSAESTKRVEAFQRRLRMLSTAPSLNRD